MNENLDLSKLLRVLLGNIYIIIGIVFLGTALSILNYYTSTKYYEVVTRLQVSPASSSMQGEIPVDFLSGSQTAPSMTNLLLLYNTRSNLTDLVKNLNLRVSIDKNFDEDIFFNHFALKVAEDNSDFGYWIEFQDSDFKLFDENKNLISNISYDEKFENEELQVSLSKPTKYRDGLYEVRVLPLIDTVETYEKSIDLKILTESRAYITPTSGIIEVSLVDSDVERAQRILNEANKIFIEKNIKTLSGKARKAIEFLDTQITSIQEKLISEKNELKVFQETNKSLNVDLEIKSIIEKLQEIDASIGLLDLELAKVENSYTDSNPLKQQIVDQKETLIMQKKEIEEQIISLPVAQQNFIELFRSVELSQDIYTELLNRRLGYSIVEASTIGNISIIDDAYVDIRVSPSPSSVFISFFMSGIFAVIFALIRGYVFTPVRNPAEIQDAGIECQVVGVTQFIDMNIIDESKPLLHIKNELDNSINSLVFSTNSLFDQKGLGDKKCKKILFTSPTANNGKSTHALFFAKKLASFGHKVLLIDGDFKRGNLHKDLNVEKITKNEYFQLNENEIEKYKVEENLYFLPRISKIQSSMHFLYDPLFNQTLNGLENKFDYMIIDTAPLLGIADTQILINFTDVWFLVVRHEVTHINEIKQTLLSSRQAGQEPDGLIYNAYKKVQGYYYYGNYEYKYYADRYVYGGYDYESDEK